MLRFGDQVQVVAEHREVHEPKAKALATCSERKPYVLEQAAFAQRG
ncbi:MAG TPA: hypothetical protein VFS67_36500 [Polyangiaceae bacterium]|nr:hypothetical protein [Polyangiaceae bacterium]